MDGDMVACPAAAIIHNFLVRTNGSSASYATGGNIGITETSAHSAASTSSSTDAEPKTTT